MAGGPYRSTYLKTRNAVKFLIPLGLLIVLAALILVFGRSKKEISPSPPAAAAVPAHSPGSTINAEPGTDSAATEELDDEAKAVIAEIQRQIEQDKRKRNPQEENPADSQITTTTDGYKEKPAKAKKESGPDYVDLFNDCRYSFTVKYQLLGGVDLYVLDSYTGEMRIRTNFTQDKPLALFGPDDMPGKRRFAERVAHQLKGGADVYVLDTFTGEIEIRYGVTGKNSLRFFENDRDGSYRRYSAQVIYNSGKLDFFITDMSGGETRIKRDLEIGDSLSLFDATERKDRGKPRYNAWIELNSGTVNYYILDTISGELRIREKIGNDKSLSLFEGIESKGPERFDGWVNYNAGALEIFAIDRFTGELKMFPNTQGKTTLRLFDFPVDDRAWMRYQCLPDYVLDRYWIYTFDSATSELTSDSHLSFKTPYAFPALRKYVPPSGYRYDCNMIRDIGGAGVITYVIDTYTSEVRVAKGIAGKGRVMLF